MLTTGSQQLRLACYQNLQRVLLTLWDNWAELLGTGERKVVPALQQKEPQRGQPPGTVGRTQGHGG